MDVSQKGMMDDGYWSTFTSNADDYELGTAIGFGASSTVYAGVFRSQGGSEGDERNCAIKVSAKYPDEEQLFKEFKLLSLCRHQNVLRILAAFPLPPDYGRIAIVTPLVSGGSLAGILEWRSRLAQTPKTGHFFRSTGDKKGGSVMTDGGVLDEEEVKAVVKQVLEGLRYIHSKGFLHRDLKAGNLLVALDGTILLADFGVGGDLNDPLSNTSKDSTSRPTAEALRFGPSLVSHPASPAARKGGGQGLGIDTSIRRPDIGKRKSFVGTPMWMAPEVILGQKYDSKADIWSLGMTIIELAQGSLPYARDRPDVILSKILTVAPPALPRSGPFSKHMREFLSCCLDKEPSRRWTSNQLLEHPWLKTAKKKVYLAETLLSEVPILQARQELRRVPTVSSITSWTSTWDFATTPAVSIPPSPIRSTFGMRSPSSASGTRSDYFPFPPAIRSHSRSPSVLTTITGPVPRPGSVSGLIPPPSPRIPLRQWAERTASVDGSPISPSVSGFLLPEEGWRSNSARGSKRSSSSRALRQRASMPFDGLITGHKSHGTGQAKPTQIMTDEEVQNGDNNSQRDDVRHNRPESKNLERGLGKVMSPLLEYGQNGLSASPDELLLGPPAPPREPSMPSISNLATGPTQIVKGAYALTEDNTQGQQAGTPNRSYSAGVTGRSSVGLASGGSPSTPPNAGTDLPALSMYTATTTSPAPLQTPITKGEDPMRFTPPKNDNVKTNKGWWGKGKDEVRDKHNPSHKQEHKNMDKDKKHGVEGDRSKAAGMLSLFGSRKNKS